MESLIGRWGLVMRWWGWMYDWLALLHLISLTDSVPVNRAGMASGTADLQRDLGGAIMQSILGALLTAGYAAAFNKAISSSNSNVSSSVQSTLTKSFASASDLAAQYPQYQAQIIAAAKSSFLD